MTAQGHHQAHDRLLAHATRIEQRLADLGARIDELDEQDRAVVGAEREALASRCQDLVAEIRSWTDVEVGVTTAVENLEAAVDTLEADVEALEPAEPQGGRLAMDRQVRAWKRRVEWLRLQGVLGGMEARDDLDDLSRRLDRVRGDVLVELQSAAEDSKMTIVDLRRDVEKVLVDVRRAVARTASGLTSR